MSAHSSQKAQKSMIIVREMWQFQQKGTNEVENIKFVLFSTIEDYLMEQLIVREKYKCPQQSHIEKLNILVKWMEKQCNNRRA